MAEKIVLVDTSILIDLFRKTDKNNSKLLALLRQGYSFKISAITEYEIYSGATTNQLDYWNNLLQKIQVLPFDQAVVKTAVEINQTLKQKRKQIDIADLFIAATAIRNNLPFATLNKKHFERIDELIIIE
ncbi:type II toxin-antitoxin system VapC family toxin [Dyadobacter sp. CY356]|uniref:type II toxin-antitoxin system VapC family toxin n=1 Tax=Dyadobacter sp. CY356 TaxID=2906442 RepID=UPI001F3EEDAB|nr:type II toxin-antitoxin system VapC family toxin [Dyadobacter sp. CY356]MCF0058434.1 type II toxin-antitoxin system VapC family toxin [Dyadobacter sp. CY356]